MKNSVWNIIKNIFFIFIILIFIAGYSSEKIQEALLPRVTTVKSYDVKEVETSVVFDGYIDVKEKMQVRFSYPVNIVEWYVESGEFVAAGEPVFRVDNFEDVEARLEEEARLLLSLKKLEDQYKALTGQSFSLRKLQLQMDEINKLKEQLNQYKTLSKTDPSYLKNVEETELLIQHKEYLFAVQLQNNDALNQSNLTTISDVGLEIMKIKNQLSILENKEVFYSHIGNDGVCYAMNSGVVTDLMKLGYYEKDKQIMTLNIENEEQPFIFTGTYNADFEYLIQKNDEVFLDVGSDKPPLRARIIKVYEALDGVGKVDAVLESEHKLILGQEVSGKSLQAPASTVNVPRTAIISKGEIKNSTKVEFFCVVYESGVLGSTAKIVRSYGSVAYVGDDYIGLSDKTLPSTFTPIIVDNPSPTLKSGDRITE